MPAWTAPSLPNNNSKAASPRLLLLAIATALYAASFALPWWFKGSSWSDTVSGFEVFDQCLHAGFYYFLGPLAVAFNAPFWLAALCALLNWRWATAVFASLGFGGAVFLGAFVHPSQTTSLGPGFFVWGASMVAVAMPAWIKRR